jgi:hypothetical protein
MAYDEVSLVWRAFIPKLRIEEEVEMIPLLVESNTSSRNLIVKPRFSYIPDLGEYSVM